MTSYVLDQYVIEPVSALSANLIANCRIRAGSTQPSAFSQINQSLAYDGANNGKIIDKFGNEVLGSTGGASAVPNTILFQPGGPVSSAGTVINTNAAALVTAMAAAPATFTTVAVDGSYAPGGVVVVDVILPCAWRWSLVGVGKPTVVQLSTSGSTAATTGTVDSPVAVRQIYFTASSTWTNTYATQAILYDIPNPSLPTGAQSVAVFLENVGFNLYTTAGPPPAPGPHLSAAVALGGLLTLPELDITMQNMFYTSVVANPTGPVYSAFINNASSTPVHLTCTNVNMCGGTPKDAQGTTFVTGTTKVVVTASDLACSLPLLPQSNTLYAIDPNAANPNLVQLNDMANPFVINTDYVVPTSLWSPTANDLVAATAVNNSYAEVYVESNPQPSNTFLNFVLAGAPQGWPWPVCADAETPPSTAPALQKFYYTPSGAFTFTIAKTTPDTNYQTITVTNSSGSTLSSVVVDCVLTYSLWTGSNLQTGPMWLSAAAYLGGSAIMQPQPKKWYVVGSATTSYRPPGGTIGTGTTTPVNAGLTDQMSLHFVIPSWTSTTPLNIAVQGYDFDGSYSWYMVPLYITISCRVVPPNV